MIFLAALTPPPESDNDCRTQKIGDNVFNAGHSQRYKGLVEFIADPVEGGEENDFQGSFGLGVVGDRVEGEEAGGGKYAIFKHMPGLVKI